MKRDNRPVLARHRYEGLCPDAVEGWDARDPECEACMWLDRADRAITSTSAVNRIALDHPGLVEWLAGHDRGASSNAMVTRMTGIQATRGGVLYPPSDADDFGRCFRLLEAVPTLRPLLGEMRDVSTTWARLVDGWDGIEHCYRLDLIESALCDERRIESPPVARTYIEMNRVTGPTSSNVTETTHRRYLALLELDRARWERDRPDVVAEALQRVVTP